MMSRRSFVKAILGAIAGSLALLFGLPASLAWPYRRRPAPSGEARVEGGELVLLPYPRLGGEVSVERALADRRSIREYTDEPITIDELSQVLWATYGVTETRYGLKTSPSAGATYPLEVYVVVHPYGVRMTDGSYLEPGSYKYDPHSHTLRLVKKGDLSRDLYRAALNQEWVLRAKANIVIAAVYRRTTSRYGERGIRYVHIEVGHAGQNIYLQATALGLATVAIGAFYDGRVKEVVGLDPEEEPLYIMPLAKPLRPYRLYEEDLVRYIEDHRRGLVR